MPKAQGSSGEGVEVRLGGVPLVPQGVRSGMEQCPRFLFDFLISKWHVLVQFSLCFFSV